MDEEVQGSFIGRSRVVTGSQIEQFLEIFQVHKRGRYDRVRSGVRLQQEDDGLLGWVTGLLRAAPCGREEA